MEEPLPERGVMFGVTVGVAIVIGLVLVVMVLTQLVPSASASGCGGG